MTIRPAKKSEIPQIARIHKERFADHFLAGYSTGLLEQFYESFVESFIFLVSLEEGTVNGFVLGGRLDLLTAQRRQFLFHHLARFTIETALRPSLYRSAVQRLPLFFLGSINSQGPPAPVGLLSIAVTAEAEGTGVAKALVRSFEEHLKDFRRYRLTVNSNNWRAIRFFKKMGLNVETEDNSSVWFVKEIQCSQVHAKPYQNPSE